LLERRANEARQQREGTSTALGLAKFLQTLLLGTMNIPKDRSGISKSRQVVDLMRRYAKRLLGDQAKSPETVPAHVLWVELSTRITTQSLHYRSGSEEAAAKSVYDLFKLTRQLMETNPEAEVFCEIALVLLNEVLRPYTARWHGWIEEDATEKGPAGRFRDEIVRRKFRLELRDLQASLIPFQEAFLDLSKGKHVPREQKQEKTGGNPTERHACLGQSIEAGIDTSPRVWAPSAEVTSPEIINKAEQKFILERRSLFQKKPIRDELIDAIGLSLSGGGIRSATVCLGVIQVLAAKGIFAECDYLSTVSGGGYFGTLLTSFLRQKGVGAVDGIFGRGPSGTEADAVRHLRNNSRYLVSGGLWGKIRMVGLMVSGIAANLLMILPLAFSMAVLIYVANFLGYWGRAVANGEMPPASWNSPAGSSIFWSVVVLLVLWMVLLASQRLTLGSLYPFWTGFRGVCTILTLLSALVTIGAVVIFCVPLLYSGYDLFVTSIGSLACGKGVSEMTLLAIFTAFPFALGAATILLRNPRVRAIACGIFVLSGPVFYIWVALFVGTLLGLDGRPRWNPVVTASITAVGIIWSWKLIDINSLGPHGYYRDRLCECYLVASDGERHRTWLTVVIEFFWNGKRKQTGQSGTTAQSAGGRLLLPLTDLQAAGAAPYHLVNATVNLPTSKNPDLRGRAGDFFIFSPFYCGSAVCGYAKTESLQTSDRHVDLGSAMAISGAAASTNMGWRTLPNFRFLMAILNIRLGYWIPNVQRLDRVKGRGVGLPFLVNEIMGKMHEHLDYLNVSDGGHIENLGVYELLRRHCKFIICVHGGADLKTEGSDLQRLERYAAIDLGIEFEYNLRDLQPDGRRISRAYAVLIKAKYPAGKVGWMIYLKPAITGTEPQYVSDYRYRNASFPFDSILNQIYDEEEFEAYRAIGECAAESLFSRELIDGDPNSVGEWFQMLANNLLPDNDEVCKRQNCTCGKLEVRPNSENAERKGSPHLGEMMGPT
jgi:hypothetical protein